MPKRQPSSSGSKCPSCQTALHPNARFCHECGKPAGERRDEKRWDWKSVAPIVISIATFAAVLAFMLGNFASEQKILPNLPQSDVVSSSPQLKQPIDLSTMSPREAADHLFNRVMLANERGDTAQATQFAPMALEAYRLIERLDADAYYHMGLIGMVTGDLDEVRRQVENIKRESAEHLLGLALAMSLAERVGDESAKADILARFAAAYEVEMGPGKPEYEAHSAAIAKLHAATSGSRTAETSNQDPKPLETGAQLFASKCAGCHGPNASGSNKGPSLVHQIYEPGHHDDASFYRAVRQGVTSHHWSFGNMMPITDITDKQIGQIILYIRDLQIQNGIK